jgi:hypothetical protein
LPDWHADAQVQLGWIFDDPINPQDSDPLTGWDKAIGDIPAWSYDPDRMEFDQPAQWFIRIPNLNNDNPAKKVWISWVYEFDTSLDGDQSATNIDWYPNSGSENPQYAEEWFDSDGNPTTDSLQAVYGRITASLDLYPNPQYEDIWLGVYGDSKNALEVYIKTLCVTEVEPEPEFFIDIKLNVRYKDELTIDIKLKLDDSIDIDMDIEQSGSSNYDTKVKLDFQMNGDSTDIKIVVEIKESGSSDYDTRIIIDIQMGGSSSEIDINVNLSGNSNDIDISIDIKIGSGSSEIAISVNLSGNSNDIDISIVIKLGDNPSETDIEVNISGSFYDIDISIDIMIDGNSN